MIYVTAPALRNLSEEANSERIESRRVVLKGRPVEAHGKGNRDMSSHQPEVDLESDRIMSEEAREFFIREMGKEWLRNNVFCTGFITLEKAREIVAYFKQQKLSQR